MSENEQAKGQPVDSADVLAGMAQSDNADQALASLAAGEVPPEENPLDTATGKVDPMAAITKLASGEDLEPTSEEIANSVDENAAPAPARPKYVAPPANPQAAALRAQAAALAYSHAYKKFMIPLLIIIGVLLLVVGIITAYMVSTEGDRRPLMVVVMLLSFPLGGALLFGAWWFNRDVSYKPRR
jgi:hypothetical protein